MRKVPVPTPRQTRTPSAESEVLVTSHSEPVLSLPSVVPEWVAEFDPLSKLTSSGDEFENVFIEQSTVSENGSCLSKLEQTEPLRSDTVHTSNEVNQYNGVVDQSHNGLLSESLVSSAENVRREMYNNVSDLECTELEAKLRPEVACSTQYTAGDGNCVSPGGRQSYLEVWNCSSTHPLQSDTDTGLASNDASFLPLQREIIKSDESAPSRSSASVSSVGEDPVFSAPPVPKKRSFILRSSSDHAVKSSPCNVPSRVAPPPPRQYTEVRMATICFDMDDKTLVAGSKMAATSSDLSGLPALPDDSSFVSSATPDTRLQQLLSSEEEQTCNVSFLPHAMPREPPRPPVATVTGPSQVRERLPPLIMPSAMQQPPTSTACNVPLPLEKVNAVGSVKVPATGSTSKTSTSSELTSPMSPPTCTPPVPPPKRRRTPELKNGVCLLNLSRDGETTDEDTENGDVSNGKF